MVHILDSQYLNITDEMLLVTISELYKFQSNAKICKLLESKDLVMTTIDSEYLDYKFSNVKFEVNNLGFYFSNYDEVNGVVTLVTSVDKVKDKRVEIHFPNDKVIIKAITPLNYLKISDKLKYEELIIPQVMFFRIIADAIEMKATDVHFETYKISDSKSSYPIKYRMGNDLSIRNLFLIDESLNSEMIKSVVKGRLPIETSDIDSIGGISSSCNNPFYQKGNDLRITITKTNCGYMYTIRIMGAGELIKSVESLGFPDKVNNILYRMTRSYNGMSLVTGPQRSGKNTTIFAVVNQMLDKGLKILDYSSPIETLLTVDQVDYKGDSEYLSKLVKIAKKHDADIALINEIPNKDTAESIYDLVNSSVGVMTTFHINRIWHLCYKLKEYFGDNMNNLFTHLKYVINQKIFIKQCPHCLESKTIEGSRNVLIPEVLELSKIHNITTYKESQGCSECNYKGILPGIQPYIEYLVFDDIFRTELFNCPSVFAMEQLIREKVKSDKSSLEDFVIKDIYSGILHPNQLINLV